MSASGDGAAVFVLSSKNILNICVADLPAGNATPRLLDVRRWTFTEAADFAHAWTPDSRSVIFESNRNGTYDLFRQALDRREAEPLVVSPDGTWILYRQHASEGQTVMRAAIGGGHPEVLAPAAATAGEFRCGLQPGSRCVIRTVENDQFVFHELDPVSGGGASCRGPCGVRR